METMTKPRFELGRLLATPGALEALERHGQTAMHFLARHIRGDWGDLDDEDKQENEFSIEHGFRILSAYKLNGGSEKIWIITEADRHSTTILLPEEY